MRIAIIGAGVSGLTAGLELHRRGFKDVVIFEKESRVGGKTFSYEYKGSHYDLGSMMFSRPGEIADLADRYNIPYRAFDTKDFYYSNHRYLNPVAFANQWYSLFDIFWSLYGLHDAVRTHELEKPGYAAEIHPDLFQSFQEYLKTHHLEAAAKAFQPAITGLGYGYYDSMPALFCLKIMSSMMEASLLQSLLTNGRKVCFFPGGWQELWEKVAENLDVRTDAHITSIHRSREGVKITVNGKTETFDRLMITAPLTHVDEYLDVSEEEKRLFDKFRSHRMVTTLVEGSTPLKTAFLADNAIPERLGHVLGIECYLADTNCAVLFQTAPKDMPHAEVTRLMVEDLSDMGWEVKNVVIQKEWEYFYHVSSEDLADGFYRKLNALQGKRHTYYLGSALNYETVAHCQQFAEYIVETYF